MAEPTNIEGGVIVQAETNLAVLAIVDRNVFVVALDARSAVGRVLGAVWNEDLDVACSLVENEVGLDGQASSAVVVSQATVRDSNA